MKHENENMPSSEQARSEQPQIDQEAHERLCAYVFGELQGAERGAFEAELLRSPPLQRERERLTATIGLVKQAVPDEGLSAAVRRDLVAAARRSRFRFLRGRSLVRVAAAAALILGGVLGVRMFTARVDPARHLAVKDARVARSPEPLALAERERAGEVDRAKARELGQDERKALRAIGYTGENGPSAAPAGPAPAIAAETAALDALGYGGDGAEDAETLAWDAGLPAPGALQDEVSAMAEGSAQVISLGAPAEAESGHYGTGTPSAFVSRKAGGGGRAAVATQVVAPEPAGALPPPARGGAYRGPGDTKPPSSEVLLAFQSKELEGFAAGSAGLVRQDAGLVVERFEALGYAGQDDADEKRKRDGADGFFLGQREPVLTREQVAVKAEQLLDACRVAPGESPGAMFFRYWGDSPFLPAEEQATSTFAIDVDTASYALARSYLSGGELPPREAVRTEEFVNYFKADQAPPTDGKPFAIGLELAPSLFTSDARTEMLRVTVRGKEVASFERQPLSLTFVIDNSGSMREGGRLELVKRALALLLRQLYASDSVAVVKFSNDAAVVTPMIPAARRGELEGLIQALPIEGGTNVEAGLRLGYEQALQSLARNAVNRVILCSDGVGNIGETSARGLVELVEDARAKGIYLNTVGVGMGNHDDAVLEQLADEGDGVCNYVDSDAEAKRVFVDGLASLVQPIARDVKIQVEFDPAQVESWRQLGYENRALRAQDFRDDRIDAGEVNAGHQVTALYELVRLPGRSGPLATVRLRYKPPFAIDQGKEGERAQAEAEQALEQERTLQAAAVLPGFAAATNGFQRSVLVTQFAEVLRQSVHARKDSFATLLGESRRLEKALGDPDFTEFVALLEKANPLLDARSRQETPRVQQLRDELSRLHYEQALRGRKHQLARESGEPPPSADEAREIERVEAETKAAIQRLEAEVITEVLRASGIEPLRSQELERLRGLGYVGDDEK